MGSVSKALVNSSSQAKPLTGLYHGSRWLGAVTNGGWQNGQFTPPKGTDVTGAVDPSMADIGGMLGPAALYTTTHPNRASQFGPLYGVDLSAAPKDFVPVDHKSRQLSSDALERVGRTATGRMLERYYDTTGIYPPQSLTVSKMLWDVGLPHAAKSLRGGHFDPDKTIIPEIKNMSLDEVARDMLRHDGDAWEDDAYNLLPEGAISDASGAASAAYRKAVQDFVTGSGAAGFVEQYPLSAHFDQSKPDVHYAVYDPAAIIRLIKLGVLPAVAAGSQAQDQKTPVTGALLQ